MTFGLAAYFIFAFLVAPVGINRRIGFWKTLICAFLLTPFVALFVDMSSGRLDAKGCRHCGNHLNEAEFCGICGKNEDGLTREEMNKDRVSH